MCNRYSSTKNEAHLQLRRAAIAIANLFTRFNIAPQSRAPIVAFTGDQLTHRDMRWGMTGFHGRLVTNAKSETARDKQLFRQAWAQRRCVIPADSFYEWKTEGRAKLPYRFVLQNEALFWFAGLWNEETTAAPDSSSHRSDWEPPFPHPMGRGAAGEVIESSRDVGSPPGEERFVILTRAANADVRRIHHRMPLILAPDEIDPWLDARAGAPRDWVPSGLAEGALRSYRIGSAVSKPGVETPECIAPLVGGPDQAELW